MQCSQIGPSNILEVKTNWHVQGVVRILCLGSQCQYTGLWECSRQWEEIVLREQGPAQHQDQPKYFLMYLPSLSLHFFSTCLTLFETILYLLMPLSSGHFRCAFLHWIRSNGKQSSNLWFSLRSDGDHFAKFQDRPLFRTFGFSGSDVFLLFWVQFSSAGRLLVVIENGGHFTNLVSSCLQFELSGSISNRTQPNHRTSLKSFVSDEYWEPSLNCSFWYGPHSK